MLLVSPFAGVVSDRFDRRSVLIVMQVALMLHALVMAALAWQELLAAWHVPVAAFLMGTAMALETSARQSFVPVLVEDRADLPSALVAGAIAHETGVEPVIAAGGACVVLAAVGLGRRMPEFREHLRPIYQRLGLSRSH